MINIIFFYKIMNIFKKSEVYSFKLGKILKKILIKHNPEDNYIHIY